MKKRIAGIALTGALVIAVAQDAAKTEKRAHGEMAGRWDLTLTAGEDKYPSWIEITRKAGRAEVRLVGRVASVHPGDEVKFDGTRLTFKTSEWFGKTLPVSWEFEPDGDKLKGKQTRGDGTVATIVGVRAPAGARLASKWGTPKPLFNGKDLTGWEPVTTGEPGKSPVNHYKAIHGELVNEAPGANIRTKDTFQDFKLHVEYNCPKDGNSGVYLRGRYELQVEYESAEHNDALHAMGSIYGFIAPSVVLPKKPGEWETFDVMLVGRHVTVTRNGVKTIDNKEIPGITGGALDSHEGEPGPIYIQGDHTGGMKYRNITIATPGMSTSM